MIGYREKVRLLCAPIFIILSSLMFVGCWDYTGLHEQTVVAGMAVDLSEDGAAYILTLEIVDLNGASDGQFGAQLLTTTGETFASAVFDAYARLHSNVYLGVMDVVLISEQVAEHGMGHFVDYFIRDRNARSSLHIVVAGTDTAAELLTPTEEEGRQRQVVLSQVLAESLGQHRRGASTTARAPQVVEVFDRLATGTATLALPVVAFSEAADIPFQLDGLALFTGDRMTGRLAEADMPIYLLATTGLRDRVFPVQVMGPDGVLHQVVLAARGSEAHVRFKEDAGRLRFWLDIEMTADVLELQGVWGTIDQAKLRQIEAFAEAFLTAEVLAFAERFQDEGRDVLLLLEAIRHRDAVLWRTVSADAETWLRDSEITPRVRVRIGNTGMMKG